MVSVVVLGCMSIKGVTSDLKENPNSFRKLKEIFIGNVMDHCLKHGLH